MLLQSLLVAEKDFWMLRIYEKNSCMQQSCYTNVFPRAAFANLPENGDAEIFIRLL